MLGCNVIRHERRLIIQWIWMSYDKDHQFFSFLFLQVLADSPF